MIVAVDENLIELKEALEQRGYKVVRLGENKSVDAVVYYNNGDETSKGNFIMTDNSVFSGENIRSSNGVFMVNASQRSIEEIDQILKNKIYSPFFE